LSIRNPALCALALLGAVLPSIQAAAPPSQSTRHVAVAGGGCKQAISQSRLLCLTGSNCQREISPVLRTCHAPQRASCTAAREDLRAHCSTQSPWYGSRECESALRQVGHYCDR